MDEVKGTILESYATKTGEEFVVVNIILTDDGYGGQAFRVVEGLHFNAVFIESSSIQTEVAQQQGVTGIYTLMYSETLNIPPRTVIRRIKDNKYIQTKDLDGNPMPDLSSIKAKVTRAEDYTLPRDIV
jgi:hypothetical protein